jgi:hypothetical protein
MRAKLHGQICFFGVEKIAFSIILIWQIQLSPVIVFGSSNTVLLCMSFFSHILLFADVATFAAGVCCEAYSRG